MALRPGGVFAPLTCSLTQATYWEKYPISRVRTHSLSCRKEGIPGLAGISGTCTPAPCLTPLGQAELGFPGVTVREQAWKRGLRWETCVRQPFSPTLALRWPPPLCHSHTHILQDTGGPGRQLLF